MTNNADNRINPGMFGPGVIGKELYEAEQSVVERQADIFGPGVVGLPADGSLNKMGPGVVAEEPPASPAPPMLSVRAVREALEASPLLVDTLLAGELARPDRRKGALEALLDAETQRPDGARPEVVAQIEAALGIEPVAPIESVVATDPGAAGPSSDDEE